jgi:hypothetical protein
MKQKDIVLIIFVVGISGLASFFISKKIFVTEKDTKQQTKVVEKISTEFTTPSKSYFNAQSINPTQTIRIGDTPQTPPTN